MYLQKYSILTNYHVNPNTYLIEPFEYDGKLFSRIYEKYGIFYVAKKPLKLVHDSFKRLGTTYDAAVEYSKSFFEDGTQKLPVVMFFDLPYTIFPLYSPYSSENIWIAFSPIFYIRKLRGCTEVIFENETKKVFPLCFPAFSNRHLHATLLTKYAIRQRFSIQKELGLLHIKEFESFINYKDLKEVENEKDAEDRKEMNNTKRIEVIDDIRKIKHIKDIKKFKNY